MRAIVAFTVVLVTSCAARLEPNACSDPLRLYTASVYQPCCVVHDADYLRGGTEMDRLIADQQFYRCLRVRGSDDDAASMFFAVRLGGRARFHYTKGSR